MSISKYMLNTYVDKRKLLFVILLSLILVIHEIPLQYVLASVKRDEVGEATGIAVYKGKAFPVNVTVEVREGLGYIKIVGVRYDRIFYESIKNAVYEASWILGKIPFEHNFTVYVSPRHEVSYLSGTSLSLAVYVATLSAFTGLEYNKSIILTGTINPDSTVGFVGYVGEKAVGAEKYNYSTFLYPSLQDKDYKVVKETIHMGPYVFLSHAVEVKPVEFNITSIKLIQVSNGLDAFLLGVRNYSVNLVKKPILKVNKTDEVIMEKAEVLRNYLRLIENRTNYMIGEINDLRVADNLYINMPLLDKWVGDRLENISLYLKSYKMMLDKGLLFAALDYITLAYGTCCETYYLLLMVLRPGEAPNYISVDYQSTESRIQTLLLRALENNINPDDILLLSEASRLFYDASRRSRIYLLGLSVINSNMFNSVSIKSSIARVLAEAKMKLTEAEPLILMTLSSHGNHTINMRRLIDNLMSYGDFLFKFSHDYSKDTRVISELIDMGGGYIWRSKNILKEMKSNNTLLAETSLDYILNSIGYSQLYFSLHPGFKGVAEERYKAVLKTFAYYLNSTGRSIPCIVQYMLEQVLIYKKYDSKLSFLERAIGYIKAYMTLTHLSNVSIINSLARNETRVSEVSRATQKTGAFELGLFRTQDVGIYAFTIFTVFFILITLGWLFRKRYS